MVRAARNETAPTDTDLAWCHATVPAVSRTFAITIDVLDEPMSSRICLGYLICRIADTIEDASHVPPAAKVDLLERFDAVLDPDATTDAATFVDAVSHWVPDEPGAEWDLVMETPRVFGAFEETSPSTRTAMRAPMRELVQGLALFVDRHAATEGLRIRSRRELEEYCHYAAGTVGELITNLTVLGADVEAAELRDRGHAFGILLQLVNIAKDVHDDYEAENNVYLPSNWLAEEGVDQEEVCAREHREGSAAVVRRTVAHARTFVDDAETYLHRAPFANGRSLAAWGIPFLLAIGTMRELSARPAAAVAPGAVKVDRPEVLAIIDAVTDDPTPERISELRAAVADEPLAP